MKRLQCLIRRLGRGWSPSRRSDSCCRCVSLCPKKMVITSPMWFPVFLKKHNDLFVIFAINKQFLYRTDRISANPQDSPPVLSRIPSSTPVGAKNRVKDARLDVRIEVSPCDTWEASGDREVEQETPTYWELEDLIEFGSLENRNCERVQSRFSKKVNNPLIPHQQDAPIYHAKQLYDFEMHQDTSVHCTRGVEAEFCISMVFTTIFALLVFTMANLGGWANPHTALIDSCLPWNHLSAVFFSSILMLQQLSISQFVAPKCNFASCEIWKTWIFLGILSRVKNLVKIVLSCSVFPCTSLNFEQKERRIQWTKRDTAWWWHWRGSFSEGNSCSNTKAPCSQLRNLGEKCHEMRSTCIPASSSLTQRV